jgi:hypothetical protein
MEEGKLRAFEAAPSHSQLFTLRYELGIPPLLARWHQAVTQMLFLSKLGLYA